MATRYIESIAKLCRVQVSDLGVEGIYEIPAQKKLVEDFILKRALFVEGTEPHRISDDFMYFMAEFGHECYDRDEETGVVLLELAMQRISRGAVWHEDYDFVGSLPEKYQQYSAKDSAPGLMTAACWLFIKNQLSFCVEALRDATLRHHARIILTGIVRYINEDGSFNDGFELDEFIGEDPAEIRKWALRLAGKYINLYDLVAYLAPVWRNNRRYFKYMENVIDWYDPVIMKAFKHDAAIDKQGKPYFSRRTKIFLKIVGLYQLILMLMITQDMRKLP